MVASTSKSNNSHQLCKPLPSYLSEVRPEEHAFILLERTRWTWVRRVALLHAVGVFEWHRRLIPANHIHYLRGGSKYVRAIRNN